MTDATNGGGTRVFLASDQIWPRLINAAFPGARFVARAKTSSAGLTLAPVFEQTVTGDVWGVLIDVAQPPEAASKIRVTADDGAEAEAWLGSPELLAGDPQSVFMASRYWELHPSFIQELRVALQARGMETADEEPRDDGALGQTGSSGT